MGIVAANLRDWEQQPRNWRVLEPVNDPDHERYYRHNDTPALRVQVANRLETLLKAWDGKDETDYSGDCTLQPTTIAKIFQVQITKWNDAKIAALNPGKKLPDLEITVVHRADGSGTTFNFTDYLSAVSKDFQDKVGKGAAVKWPAPTSVGGKGNEGVAANVSRVKGALGYVEYAYVKKNNMTFMKMLNADGKYVEPDDKTFASAAAGADWFSVPGMGISMVNAKGADSWPISTASFILMYKEPVDKVASAEALKFFDWAFKNGKKMAEDLDYVPLPDKLTDQIRSRVFSQIQK